MKDYYAILGIDKTAGAEQIKKAYRQMALKYHPDRNQGSDKAAEKFKELAEAYGVLSDPKKRQQYDQDVRSGFRHRAGDYHTRYNQEEIFRDLFNNPQNSQTLQDLFKEFEKAGLQFDKRFVEKVFFGGRGILFGGFFFISMFGPRKFTLPLRIIQMLPVRSIVGFLGRSAAGLLSGKKSIQPVKTSPPTIEPLNSNYEVTISQVLAQRGTFLTIALPKELGGSKIKIKIPPETKSDTRMRLKGRGKKENGKQGDLFLTVLVK